MEGLQRICSSVDRRSIFLSNIAMATVRAIAVLVMVSSILTIATAAPPQVNFPLNLQIPPVARVGVFYSFQFASTTFLPDPDSLQYSLIGNPSWLSISSRNRTLSGTPGSSDIGTATFTIAAAGAAGAVANMDTKLLVADHDAPKTTGNISQQLSKAGQLSAPDTVTLLPSKPFEINFASDTFQANGKSLSYHATLADHTPLPSWISFNAPLLRFAGTTPSTGSSQAFSILLIASDAPDYAAASLSFTLMVSNHQLLFKPLAQTLDLSKGDSVNIRSLRGKAFLDNAPIRDEDIQSATAELPHWLSFNNHTFDITGSPPSALMSQDISITLVDRFGDTAKHSIHLLFKSQLFSNEMGTLNITAGEVFKFRIPKAIFTRDDENLSVELGILSEWLKFDSAALTISGTIPKDFAPQDVQGSITATSGNGTSKDTQTFLLRVSGPGVHAYTGKDSSAEHTNDDESAHKNDLKEKKAGVIAGSLIGAIFASTMLSVFLFCLCRRKKKGNGYLSPKTPRSPRKTDISRPILIANSWEGVPRDMDPDLEKGKGEDALLERTPEHAPQLDLDLTTKREDSDSTASSLGEGETRILRAFSRSSWGFQDFAGPSHHPHDSMKVPTVIARRESAKSSSPLRHRRQTTTVYRDRIYRSSGLPVNRRINGLGHGRYTYSPSQSNSNFAAFRRPLSFSSYTTRSTSFLSTVPSAFAQPPTARHTTQLTTPAEERRSIRLVAGSTCESLLDRRTIDEKRNSYIRKRASAQSPFFGAGPSRVSSSSYKFPPPSNEAGPTPKGALSPLSANSIIKPKNATANRDRELPESLRIRKPSETPSVETPRSFYPGSLRRPPAENSFTRRYTEAVAAAKRDRVQKQYERPGTTIFSRTSERRRSSIRQSLRAQELKSSLNSLTGSKIFEDAEMSESVYSSEEEDIEEYERRTTVRPNQYMLPPLNLNPKSKSVNKRDSKGDKERDSKRDSKRELKRISQRDPTPYSLAIEHGGKENQPSTYSFANAVSTSKANGKGKATGSPERPKTAIGGAPRQARPAYHARTQSRTANRSSIQRDSNGRPQSRRESSKERHSRKSIHSRDQSRQSTSMKKGRERSRTQSSAYPFFDASTLPSTLIDPSLIKANKENNITTLPQKDTAASLLPRDLSGNIMNYGVHEDPKIEELASGSIGVRTSNGRVHPSARNSKLARLHSSSYDSPRSSSSKRNTTVPLSASAQSVGLGLNLVGADLGHAEGASEPQRGSQGGRQRTPLGILDDGNGGSPERVRIVEGKGKRPVSVEVNEEETSGKGRKTWGSLRGVLGRGSVWSTKETKAFL